MHICASLRWTNEKSAGKLCVYVIQFIPNTKLNNLKTTNSNFAFNTSRFSTKKKDQKINLQYIKEVLI